MKKSGAVVGDCSQTIERAVAVCEMRQLRLGYDKFSKKVDAVYVIAFNC